MSRLYFLSKAMMVWNIVREQSIRGWNGTKNIYRHIRTYYDGASDTWLFVPNHTLPLNASHISNTIHATWKYSNYQMHLLPHSSSGACKLSWLSLSIMIDGEEYEAETFLENFRLHTSDHQLSVPTLHMLFLAWCAQTKQWFSRTADVQFHVIDHNGEQQILIKGDLYIDKHKIYTKDSAHTPVEKQNTYTYFINQGLGC